MRALTAAELLDAWEDGLSMPPTRRTLALLERACPELSAQELLKLPIGRRDARLLDLRDMLLGAELTAVAYCPACGGQLESAFRSDQIRTAPQADEPVHVAEADEYRVVFRLATSADLLALSQNIDSARARRVLLQRCVVEATHDDGNIEASVLPLRVSAVITARMAAADPQADVELALSCPGCFHAWSAPFDIGSYFWQEISAWAKLMLRSVHVLARAYGWREADVLALTPTRRQIYLELAAE